MASTHGKLGVFIAVAFLINVGARPMLPDAEASEDYRIFPLWAIRGISPIEKATGGLGSILQNDPSYLIWKPSLVSQVDKSKFSISHLSSPIGDGWYSRAEFLGYSNAGEKWIWALGAASRTIQDDRTFRENNRVVSRNLLAFSADYIFGDIDDVDRLWISSGISSKGIFEHATAGDMTNYGVSFDLNAFASYRDILSGGLDLFGLGPAWQKAGDSVEAQGTAMQSGKTRNGLYQNQAFLASANVKFPFSGNNWIDRNLSVSTGLFLKKGEKPDYAASASCRLQMDRFSAPGSRFAPIAAVLHTGYSDYNGYGLGFTISYYDVSFTYAWAEDISPGHFISVQVPFGRNVWTEREQTMTRKKDYHELFGSASVMLDSFAHRRYYSYLELDRIADQVERSHELCGSECDSVEALKTLVDAVGRARVESDMAIGKHSFEAAKDRLAVLSRIVGEYLRESPAFYPGEQQIIDGIEQSERAIEQAPEIMRADTTDLRSIREYLARIDRNLNLVENIEDDLTAQACEILNTSPDSLDHFLEKERTNGEFARLELLGSIADDLEASGAGYRPYFLLNRDNIIIADTLLPSECLGVEGGVSVGSAIIRNGSLDVLRDITVSLSSAEDAAIWEPVSAGVGELSPGDSAVVPVKIAPLSGFFAIGRQRTITSKIETKYLADGRVFVDQIDSLKLSVGDPGMLSADCLDDPLCYASYADAADSSIMAAADKIGSVLRAMSRTYRLQDDPQKVADDVLVITMAVMKTISENIPDTTPYPAERRAMLSNLNEALLRGSATTGEKAVFMVSMLVAMDVPCSLTNCNGSWIVLLPKGSIRSEYGTLVHEVEIEGIEYIPFAITSGTRDFASANKAGRESIEAYRQEKMFIEKAAQLKPLLLDGGKDKLLMDQALIDFASLLVEKPYRDNCRNRTNPYLSVEEEMDVRIKLAFVFGVRNENQKVFDQYLRLLCLDDTRNWLEESGMMKQSSREEWESARNSYKQVSLKHTEHKDIPFSIARLPLDIIINSSRGRASTSREIRIDISAMYEEFQKLSSGVRE